VVSKIMTAIRLNPVTGALTGSPVTRGTSGDVDTFGVSVYPSGPNKDKLVLVGTSRSPAAPRSR
jgi:hypothetical protein